MKRLITTAAFILLVLSCGTSSDPIGPSPSTDAEFYPMTVGNQWVYSRIGTIMDGDSLTGTLTGSCTLEITGTETHSEGFDVFVQENAVTDTLVMGSMVMIIDTTYTDYLRITDTGLLGYPHLTDTDSSFTVPFPIVSGAVWNFSEEPPMTGTVLSTSVNVTVSAGTFEDCIEIQLTWIQGGNTVSNTMDSARNVGKVRNVFIQSTGAMITTITEELQSYSVSVF
ncbi:MAG: hypothetical protein ABFR50_00815 [Candidatus Fermentibacteria bacterium]